MLRRAPRACAVQGLLPAGLKAKMEQSRQHSELHQIIEKHEKVRLRYGLAEQAQCADREGGQGKEPRGKKPPAGKAEEKQREAQQVFYTHPKNSAQQKSVRHIAYIPPTMYSAYACKNFCLYERPV